MIKLIVSDFRSAEIYYSSAKNVRMSKVLNAERRPKNVVIN